MKTHTSVVERRQPRVVSARKPIRPVRVLDAGQPINVTTPIVLSDATFVANVVPAYRKR
jgi:hypothetical protein